MQRYHYASLLGIYTHPGQQLKRSYRTLSVAACLRLGHVRSCAPAFIVDLFGTRRLARANRSWVDHSRLLATIPGL